MCVLTESSASDEERVAACNFVLYGLSKDSNLRIVATADWRGVSGGLRASDQLKSVVVEELLKGRVPESRRKKAKQELSSRASSKSKGLNWLCALTFQSAW